MATQVLIKHTESGLVSKGYYGFSWTYLFFGWLVPLFRGEVGIAALHLLLSLVTLFIAQLIFCWLYNKQFMERKLTSGWVLADTPEKVAAAKLALGIA